MDRWPNQIRALARLIEARASGVPALVTQSPTGSGKTTIQADWAAECVREKRRVLLLTNRRILTSQAASTFGKHGLDHAVFAAGWDEDVLAHVQVASVQTLVRRIESGRRGWPQADDVIVDEAHSMVGRKSQKVLKHYKDKHAFIAGFTATPGGLSLHYDQVFVAGTKREMREIGALVPCKVFSPEEPDFKGVKRICEGAYEINGQRRRLMRTFVFGDMFKHWKTLNPNGLPTIVWAPGRAESRWIARQFTALGVKAEHVDGDTKDDERRQIFTDNEIGFCPVITSTGVLREGVDLPWISHGILLQPCNSLAMYDQVVGRLLRAYPGKTEAILQDHVGAYWRHPSPNVDRDWAKYFTMRPREILADIIKAFTYEIERQPIRCPQCTGIRLKGDRCPHCGFKHTKTVRAIRTVDGRLKNVDELPHKRRTKQMDDQRDWNSCLYAAANGKRPMTIGQAVFIYKKKFKQDLPFGLKNVPAAGSVDWNRHVGQVYPWTIFKRKK